MRASGRVRLYARHGGHVHDLPGKQTALHKINNRTWCGPSLHERAPCKMVVHKGGSPLPRRSSPTRRTIVRRNILSKFPRRRSWRVDVVLLLLKRITVSSLRLRPCHRPHGTTCNTRGAGSKDTRARDCW